jgi:hypothetical protein
VPVSEIIPIAGARANIASLAGAAQIVNNDVDLVEVNLGASQSQGGKIINIYVVIGAVARLNV